jgi:hypothetical protein
MLSGGDGATVSRNEVPLPRDGLLVVGWDPERQTFYGQAYLGAMAQCEDPAHQRWGPHVLHDCRADAPAVVVGAESQQLSTVSDLAEALGHHGVGLLPAVRSVLQRDKDRNR